eukprot:6098291-Amphidinium_carterae.1
MWVSWTPCHSVVLCLSKVGPIDVTVQAKGRSSRLLVTLGVRDPGDEARSLTTQPNSQEYNQSEPDSQWIPQKL